MQYKGAEKSLAEIARELNVDALVEGTVYQVGDNVRIRVQLIDALPEERNLWAQTFDRAGTDVLMMYGEIARTIAGEIHVKLTPEEETRFAKARQVNPEAYEAYLNGMSHWYKLTPPDLDAAQQYFASALEKDPDYALAHTGMFIVLAGRAQMGLVPPGEVMAEARPFLEKALEEAKAFYGGFGLTPVVEAMSRGFEANGYAGAMLAAAEVLAAISQQTYIGPWYIAYPYAAAGETEKTLEWLDKGYEIGDPNMPYLGLDHNILEDLLSDDPRFHDLLRRMNLSPME